MALFLHFNMALYKQGKSISTIAKEVGITR
ncbi:helix-turn-helix domain-containing protein, partial [Listeria monocytogenes]|nr:helix-turn-helix domain-containing protein [Listeria monocytogenes]